MNHYVLCCRINGAVKRVPFSVFSKRAARKWLVKFKEENDVEFIWINQRFKVHFYNVSVKKQKVIRFYAGRDIIRVSNLKEVIAILKKDYYVVQVCGATPHKINLKAMKNSKNGYLWDLMENRCLIENL